MEELKQTTDILFVNEIVMNEYTLREIMLDLWTYKATRNRLPLIILPDCCDHPYDLCIYKRKKIHKRNIEYCYNNVKCKRQEVCFDGKDENTGGR